MNSGVRLPTTIDNAEIAVERHDALVDHPLSGEHDPSRPESQTDDDAGQFVRMVEFVLLIVVVSIGSAALSLLVGSGVGEIVSVVLVWTGIVLAAFKFRSRDDGARSRSDGSDGETES